MVAMSSVTYAKANVESAEAEIITAQADMKKHKMNDRRMDGLPCGV